MILQGIDFGLVHVASGAVGYFGEGYPFHRWLGPLRPDFGGATLVTKTATAFPREGNMAYRDDGLTPRSSFPDCIVIGWWHGCVLNSVGLGNPGLERLIDLGRWQRQESPFLISVATVSDDRAGRWNEFSQVVRLLRDRCGEFSAPFGIQLNLSCPNCIPSSKSSVQEVQKLMRLARQGLSGVPVMLKLSVVTRPEEAAELVGQSGCDALCVSNTVPWGSFPRRIDWSGIFGRDDSPLSQFGGGGLSGAPLLPLVREWLVEAKEIGLDCPVCAGGGILSPGDAESLFDCGADAISLGSVAILRPWRVGKIARQFLRQGKES
ncbi:MAG: HisA/HisF-related TIM barrel protein [bacterium]